MTHFKALSQQLTITEEKHKNLSELAVSRTRSETNTTLHETIIFTTTSGPSVTDSTDLYKFSVSTHSTLSLTVEIVCQHSKII